jgi:hypothetical protein
MALANEILVPRYNEALHKLLAMKEGAPAPQLSPDIQPVLDVTGGSFEMLRLLGVIPWIATFNYGPHAGEYSYAGVRNPPGSNIITVVERVLFRPTGTQVLQLYYIQAGVLPWSIYGVTIRRDTVGLVPGAGMNVPQTQDCGYHSAAIAGNLIMEAYLGYSLQVDMPFVLGPGDAIIVKGPTTNTMVSISMWGYERVLEPSEQR